MTIQPISAGLAPSAFENRGNTGVFDIVELSIAKPPITQIRRKKLRLDGLCMLTLQQMVLKAAAIWKPAWKKQAITRCYLLSEMLSIGTQVFPGIFLDRFFW